MSEVRITYQQVVTAARMLMDIGETPSVVRVRKILGGIGDKEIIAKHLETWHEKLSEKNTNVKKSKRDEAITEDIETGADTTELAHTLSLVRATLESTADGILMVDTNGKIVDWNQKFADMWNVPVGLLEAEDDEVSFKYVLSMVKNPEVLLKQVQELYGNPELQGNLTELELVDGRILERYTQPQRVGNQIVGRIFSFRDITQRRRTEDALRLRNRAIEASTQGVIIIDITESKISILYTNPAFERITGYQESEVVGQDWKFLLKHDTQQAPLHKLELAIREHREVEIVVRNYKKDGTLFWNEMFFAPVPDAHNQVHHYVAIVNDITQRRQMEEQLIKQATHDALTGLPNRSLLLDRAEQAILQCRRSKTLLAMLFLDLDRFKLVNDGLGHNMGDDLLKECAQRLLLNIRENDTIARIGGDEFIALFPELEREEDAIPLAHRILSSLQKSFFINGHEINITTSIGISFYPKDGSNVETLMKHADISMYHAKDSGRNNFKFYTREMNDRLMQRMKLESSLRNALEKEEFRLYYQPLIDIHSNKIIGFEALIRWQHSQLGIISPIEFIPLAEETGLIIPISEWVLYTACKQNKLWQEKGFGNLQIAVNMSGRQFKQPDIAQQLARIVRSTQLAPKFLELELTETMLIESADETISILHELKEMGVKLAIDDFGTGYSSLNYLKQFPVNKLKIDRSFVTDINTDPNDAAITIAIINLAHSLQLNVLAEGVETQAQLDFLKEHHCDEAQGYFFGKPVCTEETEKLLLTQNDTME